MDWDKFDKKELARLEKKGYNDLGYVLLRNGGMLSMDDGSLSLKNTFWKYFPHCVLAGHTCLIFLLVISLATERNDVDNFLESAHYMVLTACLVCGNVEFIIYRDDINILFRYVGMEFFEYDEVECEVHKEMKRKTIEEVKTITTVGTYVCSAFGSLMLVIQPFIYYLSVRDEHSDVTYGKSFLIVPMYIPWDILSQEGFIYAYSVQFMGGILILANVMANVFSFVFLMVHYRCQLQILNHSIQNIESRAIQRYKKKYGLNEMGFRNEFMMNENMKNCFCDCLKQNIMHHQCLIRWESISRKIVRIILLIVFFNASILVASSVYLLIKNSHSKVRIFKFAQVLVSEMSYTFIFCYYGEQISNQSEDLFNNLYYMRWYNYGKEFNSLLCIMMTVLVKPIRSLTAIFNTPCSLETFNVVMSSAYSYFSIINGMKGNI